MGNQKNNRQRQGNLSATELFPDGKPSEAHQLGRRLVLEFMGFELPELLRIEFRASNAIRKSEYLKKDNDEDPTRGFCAAVVTQVLPMFFLDYLCARLQKPPKPFQLEGGDGSPAATLGYAITDTDGPWRRLFTEYPPEGGASNRVKRVFGGTNHHGKSAGERIIFVNEEYLPADCIEVWWRGRKLNGLTEIQTLTDQFRKASKLPPPAEIKFPIGEGSPAPKPEPRLEPAVPPELPKEEPPAKTPPQPEPKPKSPPKYEPEGLALKLDTAVRETEDEFKPQPEPLPPKDNPPAARKIDPHLFEIQNPNRYTWDDNEQLLNWGSDVDIWRVRDACEGVAIFGAVGSGKTSGSGAAIARTFLQAGFGGLVLTVKPDEARRWERLCRETGRDCDFIHVTPTSGHKLNFLQYELQRPGERFAITDDLIALFRTLIGVMSRSKRADTGDDFWTNTTNQLIRKLADVFLLAREPLTLERMVHFINKAPKNTKYDWHTLEFFSDVIEQAEGNAQHGSPEDQRIYQECVQYWTDTYPAIADVTRSGFITAFSAMADVLSGRGIHEMIGEDTNLTPEMILSGKVVVLDIPLKGNIQGGLMVQSMWKLLFQQAAERRADKGQPTARPAFLWEDEGHMFFSQHDVNFQPTARDCRAPHVILTQNLHNFFQQGHNPHAVEAVFSAMNTLLFHTNGDMTTNRWASEKIGEIRKLKLTTDGLLKARKDKDFTLAARRPEEIEYVGGMSIAEERKSGLPPEDFAKLKRGGDGTCEAVLLWLSHQFEANQDRNFCVITFEQEPQTL